MMIPMRGGRPCHLLLGLVISDEGSTDFRDLLDLPSRLPGAERIHSK